MRSRTICLVFITAIIILLSGCSPSELPTNGLSSNEITAVAGTQFTISTKPNPSTGWRLWIKVYDSNYVTLVQDKALPDNFQAHDFIFKAVKQGKTQVLMENKPYWWNDIPADKQKEYPLNTVTFTIVIN